MTCSQADHANETDVERIRVLLVDGEAQPRLAEISRPGAGADLDPAQQRAHLVRGGVDGTGWVGCSRLRTWRREPERPARLPREGAASPARVEWTYLLPDLSTPQATTP